MTVTTTKNRANPQREPAGRRMIGPGSDGVYGPRAAGAATEGGRVGGRGGRLLGMAVGAVALVVVWRKIRWALGLGALLVVWFLIGGDADALRDLVGAAGDALSDIGEVIGGAIRGLGDSLPSGSGG